MKLKNNGFFRMGRTGTINADLIKSVEQVGYKYFLHTVYDESYEICRSDYNEIKRYLDTK